MSVSAGAVHRAPTVDPMPGTHRRPVLDEKQQRRISRDLGERARNLHSDIDAPAGLATDSAMF